MSYVYSKELSLGNQPLETQRWMWPQFLGNRLAGSETLSFQHCAPQAKKEIARYITLFTDYTRVFGPVSAQEHVELSDIQSSVQRDNIYAGMALPRPRLQYVNLV